MWSIEEGGGLNWLLKNAVFVSHWLWPYRKYKLCLSQTKPRREDQQYFQQKKLKICQPFDWFLPKNRFIFISRQLILCSLKAPKSVWLWLRFRFRWKVKIIGDPYLVERRPLEYFTSSSASAFFSMHSAVLLLER